MLVNPMKYKLSHSPLQLREFGRNIQAMIEQIMLIPNREERTRQAYDLVRIMQQLHPHIKDNVESKKYLWDSLYIMSEYRLDVDSPFPKPDPALRQKPPQRIPYQQKTPIFAQYGSNVQVTLNRAAAMPDSQKKWDIILGVASFMRQCLEELDKESYLEKTMAKHIYMMTNGKIDLAPEDLMIVPRYDSPLPPPVMPRGGNNSGRPINKPKNRDRKPDRRGGNGGGGNGGGGMRNGGGGGVNNGGGNGGGSRNGGGGNRNGGGGRNNGGGSRNGGGGIPRN